MAERPTGPGVPDPASRVIGANWSLDDLTGRTESRLELVRADLAETTSSCGLVFDECTFREVSFDLAEHTSAAFLNCTFLACRFPNATFRECKFVGSRFERCEFARTIVDRGDWSFVGLPGADLRTARFEGVRMRESDLTGVDAQGGVLRGCDTGAVQWHNARLDRCDLRGSDLGSIDPWNVRLSAAKITWEQAIVLAVGMGLDALPE